MSCPYFLQRKTTQIKPFGSTYVVGGADEGICAFSGAPHSAIINCRLCRQVYRKLSFVKQSVLLPQNGSHPQIPSLLGTHTNKKDAPARVSFLLNRVNLSEPLRFPTTDLNPAGNFLK